MHLVGQTETQATLSLATGTYQDTITADFEGGFSFSDVPLVSGSNVITVTATDLAGRSTVVWKNIVFKK